MPAFTIHIAIAKRYIAKHISQVKDEEQFLKGTIAPDLDETMTQIVKDKSKSHYGKWDDESNIIDIDKFLNDEKVDLSQEYWKGYLLHLVADHYFANVAFKMEKQQLKQNKDNFYHDYNCLNQPIMQKYQIQPLENIEKYMRTTEGEPIYLKLDKVIKFIEEISSIDLNKIMINEKEEEEHNR